LACLAWRPSPPPRQLLLTLHSPRRASPQLPQLLPCSPPAQAPWSEWDAFSGAHEQHAGGGEPPAAAGAASPGQAPPLLDELHSREALELLYGQPGVCRLLQQLHRQYSALPAEQLSASVRSTGGWVGQVQVGRPAAIDRVLPAGLMMDGSD
jgi:hypothetical protein